MRLYYDETTGAAQFTMRADPESSLFPPGAYIEVPEDFSEPLAGLSVVNGQAIRSDMTEVRASGIAAVNSLVNEVRKTFVTDLVGQEMVYLRKEQEARAFIADPAPDLAAYPFISAEVGITPPGGTALDVAQTYLAMSAQWQAIGAALEQIRLGAIGQIEAAATEDAITAAVSAVQTALEGFAP